MAGVGSLAGHFPMPQELPKIHKAYSLQYALVHPASRNPFPIKPFNANLHIRAQLGYEGGMGVGLVRTPVEIGRVSGLAK